MSQWWHPTISSSATSFTSCPQSFPASRSFPMSWLFPSGGQSIGASASNEQSGLISFHIDWFDLLAVPGTHKSSSAPQFESINSSVPSLFYGPTHIHTQRLEKIITLTIWTFVSQVMSLLLKTLLTPTPRLARAPADCFKCYSIGGRGGEYLRSPVL